MEWSTPLTCRGPALQGCQIRRGGRWVGFILFKFDSSKLEPLFRVLGEPWLSNLTTSVRRRHVPEGGVQGRKTPYIRIVQILKPS